MVNITGGVGGLVKSSIILIIGIALVAGGWTFHQDAQQTNENAVEIEGTVLSSAITEVEVKDNDGGGSHIEYAPDIEYQYTYEGETYTSTSICPGSAEGCEASNAKGQAAVEEFLAQYPEGQPTTVYVLPEDPTTSFLVKTDSGSIAYFIMMGIGAIALLAGISAGVGSVKTLFFG